MADASEVARIVAANQYMVLGTADADGKPWVTPVYFAQCGDGLYWVSSPDSRHSRNLAERSSVAITVFDSSVDVGSAEAAYFDADAHRATPVELVAALEALNSGLPEHKRLQQNDLEPNGPLVAYRADIDRRFLLVRGGDPQHGNARDMTAEV